MRLTASAQPTDNFWYSIAAETHDGTQFELFQRQGLKLWRGTLGVNASAVPPPNDLYYSIGNHRWFKYFENGINNSPHNMALRLHFGRWVCREYNRRRPRALLKQLYRFAFKAHLKRIDVPDEPVLQRRGRRYAEHVLSEHTCEERRFTERDAERAQKALQ